VCRKPLSAVRARALRRLLEELAHENLALRLRVAELEDQLSGK
jgi:hypothetical protein